MHIYTCQRACTCLFACFECISLYGFTCDMLLCMFTVCRYMHLPIYLLIYPPIWRTRLSINSIRLSFLACYALLSLMLKDTECGQHHLTCHQHHRITPPSSALNGSSHKVSGHSKRKLNPQPSSDVTSCLTRKERQTKQPNLASSEPYSGSPKSWKPNSLNP